MPNAITVESLYYYANYFNNLKNANITYEIQKNDKYVSDGKGKAYNQVGFFATFQNVKSIRGLADIWGSSPAPIALNAVQSFPGYQEIQRVPNCLRVNGALYHKNIPSIRFYAQSVYDCNPRVNLFIINQAVPETAVDGHTIRTCVQGNQYSDGQIVYCADETSPFYNYVDPGHILVYVSTGEPMENGSRLFITNAITLEMNYIIAAASIHPPAIDCIMQQKAFIPSKDCRTALLKVEREIPAKLRDQYLVLKARIYEDFSKNVSGVMIGKLTRKEVPFAEINGIKITSTRADYTAGRVSIEASNLAEVVFQKLNPNEAEWDIFTLINIYTDWVNDQFKDLLLNPEGTGFATAKNFTFKINEIPLVVGCSTENTRRSINEHLINVDELSPVLRRAYCYQPPEDETEESNIANFDRFVSSVARHSLKLRDIWCNGLPVKTVFLEGDTRQGTPATQKHPKLRFVLKDKKGFHLQINVMDTVDKTKVVRTNEYRIGKFAEFVKKVEMLNKAASMGWNHDYTLVNGVYVSRSGAVNSCATGLVSLLTTYAAGITDEDKKSIVGTINYELSEAEKRSEELLNEACALTKTTRGTRDGKKGFIIPGKMRTYFVEEESLKVYDNDPTNTNPYFCVVNKGDMGVGKDALVARIFALHNDKMMVKQIHTLNR